MLNAFSDEAIVPAEICTRQALGSWYLLKGSWDLVTKVIIRVTILITPIKVLITTY